MVLKNKVCPLIFHEDTLRGDVTPFISNLYFRRSESSASRSSCFTEDKRQPVAIIKEAGLAQSLSEIRWQTGKSLILGIEL